MADHIDPSLDAIIDAVDDTPAKLALLETAVVLDIPVISSMGASLRNDPAQIRSGSIWDTSVCPLARIIRRELRRRRLRQGPVSCIYSTEPPAEPLALSRKAIIDGPTPLGSFVGVSGIFGLRAARETVMVLLKQECHSN